MGCIEVKKTVIEHHIGTVSGILDPDGGVAVKLIDGLAGFAGKKVSVYAVILCLGSLEKEHEGGQNG